MPKHGGALQSSSHQAPASAVARALHESATAVRVKVCPDGETTHEYVDGVRWDEGYVSHFLLGDGESAVRLLNPRVLITDYSLERADQLLPALEACVGAGERSLLVVAPEVRDSAVGLLVVNRERGVFEAIAAVRAPSVGETRAAILEDLAVVSGGRVLQAAAGGMADVTLADLGRARQA